MKKILFLIVMLPVVFIYGCASKSDYRQLDYEFKQMKTDSEKLHNEMAMFKKAYNPELHKVFSENVLAAEEYRQSIEKTRHDIEYISNQISDLLRQSENDRMQISENLKTATTENVVNEFRHLNREWDTTVSELSNLVRTSEKAVESSHHAAIEAAEKAGSAERSADHIAEYMKLVNRQSRSLDRINEKLKDIEFKIRKIGERLDEAEDPKRHKTKEKTIHEK